MSVSSAPRLEGAPAGGTAVRGIVEVEAAVVEGRAAVSAHLERFHDLHAHPATPPTAGVAWLRRVLPSAPPASVWAVHVDGGPGERAALVLVDRVDDGGRRTELLAGGGGHQASLAATTPAAAARLGRVLGEAAHRRGSALHLAELPDDPRVHALAAGAGAELLDALPVPEVRRPAEGEHLVSSGVRKNLRKTHNRLAHDGIGAEMSFSTDPAAFEAALPELEAAYRDRDEAHGVPCALDTPAGRDTWLARLRALGDLGRRELAVLRLDGELAAYVVGVPGGERYGIFDGRFVTRWARFSPGRLLEHEVLQRAFADPGVEVVDWMTGVAPETLLAVSGTRRRLVVRRGRPGVPVPRSAGGGGAAPLD
ncbi:CelD/BcsL family acetyltransferase involved in cellulose biosynthesis [Kineococcus radiotolerans]|uniref:CelD/BcsL family acetyltransferase involved in cellulose biosynthesis n=1 Tax=Kineococcus radiotolerans TaxID=131568 RepID=A0A7W4TMU7_KINRA|nr:GNAT family N-acetyltransferase [Kineococcus radiotolerans]MBB2901851.1 CelD/BcsL family acetyltransferase involved in cellulose biosynthesis [Kineococcus radiotolerans]